MKKESARGLEKGYYSKRAVRMISFVCALICGALFSVAVFFDFEPETRLFVYRSRYLFAFGISMTASAVLTFLLCTFAVKKQKPEETELPEDYEFKPYYAVDPLPVKIIRAFCAAVLVCEGIFRIILTVKGLADFHGSAFIFALILITIFPLALYFLPEVSDRLIPGYKNVHLAFGSVGVCWFVLTGISDYFDYSVAFSSPYRFYTELAVIVSGLAVLYDIKLHTDHPLPRVRLAFLSYGFVSAFAVTAGRLTALLSGKFVSYDDTAVTAVFASVAVFLAVKLIAYSED